MRIDAVNAYNNANYVNPGKKPEQLNKTPDQSKRLASQENQKNQESQRQNLISSEERNFFINMFPESSAQLEKYELFTRNGSVRNTNAQKGVIIDGRI